MVKSDYRPVRSVVGPKREAVAEGWRRLHNADCHSLCPSNVKLINTTVNSRRMS
jgi:hypothetical protein